MKKINIIIFSILFLLGFLTSCSTTRVLSEGECRLAKNSVKIENDDKFNSGELEKYIKQKANTSIIFGWNPFINLYNWSGKSEKGIWNKFFRAIGTAPVVYDPDLVDASVENIQKHLDYLGYYHSDVKAKVAINKQVAKVTYNVKLGKRYPIEKIEYNIPKRGSFYEDFMKDTASVIIKPGDYLSEQLLEKESNRSSERFCQLGYYGFNKNYYFFEADTLTIPSKAILKFEINEYTRNETPLEAAPITKCDFGKVNIYYPKSLKFNANVLKKLNQIRPGEPYSEGIVNSTYNRLSALRLFSSVNIELNKTEDKIVDCDINLTPSKIQGFKANLEGSTNSSGLFGISPGLTYYNKNIFRGGEWLNLSFMGNFQFKPNKNVRSTELGVSTSLSLPRFVFLPYSWFKGAIPRTEIKASYNYQDRPEYMRNILSTSFGYVGSHKRLYYQVYPLQLSIVRLYDLDEKFFKSLSNNPFMRNAYKDHFDIGSGGTFYFTNTTDVVPKDTYYYTRFQVDVAGNTLSLLKPIMKKDNNGAGKIWGTPFSQYVRGEISVGKTWFFGRKNGQSIATRALAGAGYAYGNSRVLPFEQHFYAGGANSLRGWQARSVGPGLSQADTTFVIPNQSGDMKLEANLEYRFNMFWKFAGAVFIDAGNVWTYHKTSNDSENNKFGYLTAKDFGKSIAADWGLGLRLDLSFILIRIDMGMKVHDPSRLPNHRWVGPKKWFKNDGYAVHFGVGYPF